MNAMQAARARLVLGAFVILGLILAGASWGPAS